MTKYKVIIQDQYGNLSEETVEGRAILEEGVLSFEDHIGDVVQAYNSGVWVRFGAVKQ